MPGRRLWQEGKRARACASLAAPLMGAPELGNNGAAMRRAPEAMQASAPDQWHAVVHGIKLVTKQAGAWPESGRGAKVRANTRHAHPQGGRSQPYGSACVAIAGLHPATAAHQPLRRAGQLDPGTARHCPGKNRWRCPLRRAPACCARIAQPQRTHEACASDAGPAGSCALRGSAPCLGSPVPTCLLACAHRTVRKKE